MLLTVKKVLDRILESVLVAAVAILVLDVSWQVVSRLVLARPCGWSEELAVFMLVWVSLLGGAVALERGAHLGIDYFVARLSPRLRPFTEILAFVLIAVFSLCVMIIGGADLVSSTLELDQTSPALGVKMGYVYLAVPICGFFLTLYSVMAIAERINALINKPGASRDTPAQRAVKS